MMYSREEVITPEIAEDYLRSNKSNRKIKFRAVRNYARDMKSGKWQMNPDGISFYEDGTLANGQHRLAAVIRAKTPVRFYVHRNVPMDAFIFDRGVSRSTVDVLNMKGNAPSASSTNAVALVNWLFAMAGNTNVSEDVRVGFICDNEELIAEAVGIAKLGGLKSNVCRSAPASAAIFCALYCGVSNETLKDFCTVANNSFSTSDTQTAAIVFRRYVLESADQGTYMGRKKIFITAANAIKDFAYRKPRRKMYDFDKPCAFFEKVKSELMADYIGSYEGLS